MVKKFKFLYIISGVVIKEHFIVRVVNNVLLAFV